MNLIKKAIRKYRNDGAYALLIRTPTYVMRNTLYRLDLIDEFIVRHYNDDSIKCILNYLFSTKVLKIEKYINTVEKYSVLYRDSRIIEYDGIWEQPHPEQIRKYTGKATVNGRNVYRFDDFRVFCHEFPTIVMNGISLRLLELERQGKRGVMNFGHFLYSLLYVPAKHTTGELFIIHYKANTFSHWYPEALTQLYAFEHLPINNSEMELVYVSPGSEGLKSFEKQSFSLMGYEPDHVLREGSEAIHVSKGYIPSYIHLGARGPPYPSPKELKWVRQTITSNISFTDKNYDKIYVSRQDVGRRCVDNFDEVLGLLEDKGFKIINPGETSLHKQVEIFSKADIIVGPHGGALMNIIFSTNSTLIELFQDEESNNHYFVLSNLVNIRYDYILCDPVEESHHSPDHMDLSVDTDTLNKVIEEYMDD